MSPPPPRPPKKKGPFRVSQGCEGEGALEQRAEPGRWVLGIMGTLALHGSNRPGCPSLLRAPEDGDTGSPRMLRPYEQRGLQGPKEKSCQARQESPQGSAGDPQLPLPSPWRDTHHRTPREAGTLTPPAAHLGTKRGRGSPGAAPWAPGRLRPDPGRRLTAPAAGTSCHESPPCCQHQPHTVPQPHSLASPPLSLAPAPTPHPTKPTRQR